MSLQPQDHRGASPIPVPFVHDACRNLRLVRRQFGPQSRHYRRLRVLYSRVARELDCWRTLHRHWHRLQRRPAARATRPWSIKAH